MHSENEVLNLALMQLSRRAEKAAPETLVKTFVDVGPLFTLLSIHDNQVLFGRRGTGKTHALRYLAEKKRAEGAVAVYLDLTNLGSSGGIYSDPNIPLAERATRLVVDVLLGLHNGLYDFCVENAEKYDLSKTGPLLDRIGDACTEVRVIGAVEEEVVAQDKVAGSKGEEAKVNIALKDASFSLASNEKYDASSERTRKRKVSGHRRHTVHFGAVRNTLEKFSEAIEPSRVWLLLDEWSSIPLELQPYLADLVRRSIFPVNDITVKIAAIEHRSEFQLSHAPGDYIGIEVGADMSADINLDDFLVFDNDSEQAREFYKTLFYKHVSGSKILPEAYSNADANSILASCFTQINAFDELVRAAEGVPRDAIHISSLAAQYALKERISVPHVRRAAKNWYQTGKESAVKARQNALALLHWIIDKVIGDRKARAFLLKSNTHYPLIEELFDARVLHVLKHGVSTHDQPGVRYDVYKLDYGCYVELMSTGKAPLGLFSVDYDEDKSGYVEVPHDDYRSIRRAILDLSEFEKQRQMT